MAFTNHNCFYVDKDITPYYEDGSLWDRIAGTNGYDAFEGIFPGCYFDMSRTVTAPSIGGGTQSGGKTLLVLGCNTDMNDHNVGKTMFNHISVCAWSQFGSSMMNTTADASTGYWNSLLNQQIIGLPTTTGDIAGTINQQLYAEFGNHLKTVSNFFSENFNNSVNNRKNVNSGNAEMGAMTGWTQRECQAILMNEIEVVGSIVWNSSGYDIGNPAMQYPALMYNREEFRRLHFTYWLRDNVGKKRFSNIGLAEVAHSDANTILSVRPRFILA